MVGKSAPALLRAVASAHEWRERMVDGSLHNGAAQEQAAEDEARKQPQKAVVGG